MRLVALFVLTMLGAAVQSDAPAITHTGVDTLVKGQDLVVEARVDGPRPIVRVHLAFQLADRFGDVAMTRVEGSNIWRARVPGARLDRTFAYIIHTSDQGGRVSTWPAASSGHRVVVTGAAIAPAPAAVHHLLYVAVPGVRNYAEYGGVGVLVFDIANGHRFAMLTLLLALGGLFIRSVVEVNRIDVGFRSAGTLLATLDPSERGYDESRGRQLTVELLDRIARLPGVTGAAMADNVAFGPSSASMEITAADRGSEASPVSASYSVVGGDYFNLLGIPITQGRAFDDRDRANTQKVAIINDRLASTLWPGRDALHRLIAGPPRPKAPPELYQVVGVTKTGKYHSINEAPRDYLYLPHAQAYRPRMTIHLRSDLSVTDALSQIRQQLADLDPYLSLFDITTLEDRVNSAKGPVTVGALLAGGLGVLGALLAGVGLYGLMSYVVTLRARELAIRIGLGAEPRTIATLCVSRGIRLAALGAAVGLVLAFGLVRPIQAVLVGVNTLDPMTVAIVSALILVIAVAASYLPVRRLLAADPVRMLHQH